MCGNVVRFNFGQELVMCGNTVKYFSILTVIFGPIRRAEPGEPTPRAKRDHAICLVGLLTFGEKTSSRYRALVDAD